MAKGSRSGIKTFAFLLIALVGSVVLGIGAFLMLIPGSNVFGVAYVANVEKTIFNDVIKDSVSTNLDMSDYTKIVFQTENANVKILCGTDNASDSNIVLDKNSFGYYTLGSKTDYTYEFYASGTILYFILDEPEYSFLKIGGNTTLILNINAFETLMPNIEFDIQTTNGSVNFGGATSVTASQAYPIEARKLKIITTNGNIFIDDTVAISSIMDLTTGYGTINIKGDLSTEQIDLTSFGGNITAKKFTNDLSQLNININQSKVIINQINGDVFLDSLGGIFNVKLIKGNFETSENIVTTRIVIEKVEKNVNIGNDEGNFTVDINEILGSTSILSGGGNIKISNLRGQASIRTTSASINITVNETNTGRLVIDTESGNIWVDFKNILHNHLLTSVSGQIDVKCSFDCSFYLNAQSESGFIQKVWTGEKTTGEAIIEYPVGEHPVLALQLTSNSGNIIISRYNI
ncbi:MAG: DUF4097 family beta strand repeat-containing protein [Clostridia bacterium]|nr:DUF4097 family beta strand repeat-containing protein [Clostridia bacterium]